MKASLTLFDLFQFKNVAVLYFPVSLPVSLSCGEVLPVCTGQKQSPPPPLSTVCHVNSRKGHERRDLGLTFPRISARALERLFYRGVQSFHKWSGLCDSSGIKPDTSGFISVTEHNG